MSKKEKCEACHRMVSQREIYFRCDEDPRNIVCIHCFPEECGFCLLEHPKTDFKKCRDNLYKILKKAIRGQSKIFKLRNELPSMLQNQLDKATGSWISEENDGYGFIECKEEDHFVKYKKVK